MQTSTLVLVKNKIINCAYVIVDLSWWKIQYPKNPCVVFATQKNPGVFHRPKRIPFGQNVRPKKILRTPVFKICEWGPWVESACPFYQVLLIRGQYCWFSWRHENSNYNTIDPTEILLHDVFEKLKANFHTNFRFKRVLGFVIENDWISKLLRDVAFTWRPRELSCTLKKLTYFGEFCYLNSS